MYVFWGQIRGWPFEEYCSVLREEIVHALAPCVNVLLHTPHPHDRSIQPAFFSLGARQRNVECLEGACEKCESELAFLKHAHPPQ